MSTSAIDVDAVSKMFRLYREKPSSLKARLLTSRSRAEEFWALRDVSFDVQQGEALTIQVDVKANEPVSDLDATFAVHDGDNQLVVDGRTSRAGIDLGRVSDKRRVTFTLRALPLEAGKYWVTIGLESARTARLYHLQKQ